MPLEISKTVNDASKRALQAPIVRSIANNPIYTALFIVAIMMIIVIFVFRDMEHETSLVTLTLRVGFWSFIAVTGVLFVHNHVLIAEKDPSGKEYDQLFSGSYSEKMSSGKPLTMFEDIIIPVKINTDFTE